MKNQQHLADSAEDRQIDTIVRRSQAQGEKRPSCPYRGVDPYMLRRFIDNDELTYERGAMSTYQGKYRQAEEVAPEQLDFRDQLDGGHKPECECGLCAQFVRENSFLPTRDHPDVKDGQIALFVVLVRGFNKIRFDSKRMGRAFDKNGEVILDECTVIVDLKELERFVLKAALGVSLEFFLN